LIDKKKYNKIESKPKQLESKKFTHYYIMRQDDFYLIIHCGDIGRKGFGGHGHCDQLSFHLFNKKPILVDTGTGTYTRDIKERHLFRSTSYHNTLKVNNKEQDEIEIEKPFSMVWKSKAKTIKWSSTKNKDTFIGVHYGFKPITHKRKITFDKKEMTVTIQDKVNKPSNIEINFHLDSKVKPSFFNNLYTLGTITLNTNIRNKIIDSFVSKEYNHKQKSKCIQGKGKNIKEIKTIIQLRKP
jgi:uncharacterized heparinase superfamily protein